MRTWWSGRTGRPRSSRPTIRLNVPALNVLRNVSATSAEAPPAAAPIIEEE